MFAVKKRILAVFAALALSLSLLAASLAASATETPHFVAVNETLLFLENRYIPIIADGMYYVPYQVLDNFETGVDLGIYPVYNAAIRTLTIYNREKVIAFDLTTGTCKSRDGTVLNARAMTRNGYIYVPVEFICQHFDLTYSYFQDTNYGPLIRICSESARLSDRNFIAAAQLIMPERLRVWRQNQAPTVTPTPTPTPITPTPTPVTGTSAPPGPSTATPSPSPTAAEPAVDRSDVRTYLAFRADRIDGLTTLLERLAQHQVRALFFFPAAQLAEYDGEVRRILCSGHGIGLLVSGTTVEEIADKAAEGNRLLGQIAHTDAHTLLLQGGADGSLASALREQGLLLWNTDVDALADGQSVAVRANTVLKHMESYVEKVFVLSDCSASGSAMMARILPELVEAKYDLRLAVETEL